MKTSFFRGITAAAAAVLISFAGTFAQSSTQFAPAQPTAAAAPTVAEPKVDIENFGKMDDRLYRGAQPEMDDYPALAALGVNTIIDLRNDPTDYEKAGAEANGMKYVNIPMSGWKYADDADVAKFMELMNDPETGVAYIHCKAGKHRTGLVGAVYRFNKYGWSYDQAYKEMKKFNYTSWPVHFNIKSYVRDYSKKFEKQKAANIAAASAAQATGVAN